MKAAELAGVVALALLVRMLVSLNKFSGSGVKPMHGDFEAQRHWKEVTLQLPLGDWYRHTWHNDLQYWGLDYPPLTAYHSLLMGKLAQWLHPQMVTLHRSRGAEDLYTVVFMRWSVFIADLLVFIPAAIAAFQYCKQKQGGAPSGGLLGDSGYLWFLLLCPGLLIIDHGHFQYNGISLGLALWAVVFILRGDSVLGSICFCLSLNYKQMALYMAPAFFFFLLKQCIEKGNGRFQPTMKHVLVLGAAVIGTFAVLWLPFCMFHARGETCTSSMLHVLSRMFPFNRGIFEDKVSNLWYTLSVLYDFRRVFTQQQLSFASIFLTLALLTPMAIDLLRRRTHVASSKRLLLALTNSSLAFFLASFQVHEKSLLLALIPASLLIPDDPLVMGWFQLLGMFSMYPLLVRDQLQAAYVALCCLFIALWMVAPHADRPQLPSDVRNEAIRKSMKLVIAAWSVAAVLLHLGFACVPPPVRYPDLYPALISMLCAGALTALLAYTSYWQWTAT